MFDLNKALQTAAGATALWQEELHPHIFNQLNKELPLLSLIGIEQAQSPIHQYRKRTSIPPAWVQGELSDSDFQSATYELKSAALKILRSWGGVSSFAQGMTAQFVNQLQEQLNASVLGFANTLEWMIYYGNATADSYQFDGVEAWINADTTAKTALTSGGSNYDLNAALTLTHLDNMIDKATSFQGASKDEFVFVMSKSMASRVSGLQTRITRDVQKIKHDGGFEMEAYRGVPILTTQMFTPAAVTTSPAVSGSAVSGGSLTAGTYYYAISSVTLNGEQLASASSSGVTTATTNLTARLTWTADANAKLYKIWRGTTNTVADMGLVAVIPALTYTAAGNLNSTVATWDDTGVTPNTAVKPMVTGNETVAMLNITGGERGNRLLGGMSPLGEKTNSYVSYVPLATLNGSYRFMLEGFLGFRVVYPECNIIARRAKLA